ncbi:hypothetical protein THAOC_28424, partial [Thalassiosira oceanica]
QAEGLRGLGRERGQAEPARAEVSGARGDEDAQRRGPAPQGLLQEELPPLLLTVPFESLLGGAAMIRALALWLLASDPTSLVDYTYGTLLQELKRNGQESRQDHNPTPWNMGGSHHDENAAASSVMSSARQHSHGGGIVGSRYFKLPNDLRTGPVAPPEAADSAPASAIKSNQSILDNKPALHRK